MGSLMYFRQPSHLTNPQAPFKIQVRHYLEVNLSELFFHGAVTYWTRISFGICHIIL